MTRHGNRQPLDTGSTTDDTRLLGHITAARLDQDYGAMARIILHFYADEVRAARTPRRQLYVHIAMLVSALSAAVGEPLDYAPVVKKLD